MPVALIVGLVLGGSFLLSICIIIGLGCYCNTCQVILFLALINGFLQSGEETDVYLRYNMNSAVLVPVVLYCSLVLPLVIVGIVFLSLGTLAVGLIRV